MVAMSVDRIYQRDVDTAELGSSVQTVAERMRQRTVGCLVVVNEVKEPIGIVTDRDLVIRALAEGKDPYTTRIEEVMSFDLKTMPEDGSLEHALGAMRSGGFRRLPVVDEEGKLVGIVTLDDILMRLAEEFTQARRIIERETPETAALAM
jgi:CBS domain-containing protein